MLRVSPTECDLVHMRMDLLPEFNRRLGWGEADGFSITAGAGPTTRGSAAILLFEFGGNRGLRLKAHTA
jgi:hypothetical protein